MFDDYTLYMLAIWNKIVLLHPQIILNTSLHCGIEIVNIIRQ